MRARLLVLAALTASCAATAHAGDTRLDTDAIVEALTDMTASYTDGGAVQYFSASGQTPYWDGSRLTMGRWRAAGDRYCSVWPPSPSEACYDIYRTDGGEIVWVGDSGKRWIATIADGNRMPE